MSALGLAAAFAAMQACICVAYGLAALVARAPGLTARARVAIVRALAVLACVLPLSFTFARAPSLGFAPPIQVFAAAARRAPVTSSGAAVVQMASSSIEPARTIDARWLVAAAAAVALAGVALAASTALRARGEIARVLASSLVVHDVGRARVVVSSATSTPFAARASGRAIVILDVETFASPHRRAALRHELTHHRRGDLAWAALLLGLVAPSFASPLARRLLALLGDLDELACDQAVLARGGSRDAYARCLVDAVGRATAARVFAPSLTSRALLGMRLRAITSPRRASRALSLAVALVAAGALASAAAFAGAVAVDRRVDRAAAHEAILRARAAGLDVPESPEVLAALDRLAATPDGARFARAALARRSDLAPAFGRALSAHGVPRALTAVALAESGYRDLDEAAPGGSSLAPGEEAGAGVWMFIPSTARAYGLRVDRGVVDERLDVARETDAAATLLADLHAELGDWALALAAYNQGAAHVRRAIAREGTRDATELARRGALNGYVATVMAAALVEQAPELVAR
ncbi:MAG TPA: M56 and MltD domain-containing protein [Byssovorax sp.]|jgi:beta-lactamase regulating signal transducer with metallopeptidase domain